MFQGGKLGGYYYKLSTVRFFFKKIASQNQKSRYLKGLDTVDKS